MAKTGGKTPVETNKPAFTREVSFVNYDLTAEDKVAFKAWAHENAGMPMFELMMNALEKGFNLSCKWSDFEGCHTAFLIATPKVKELNGWLLSGRGSTPFGAIAGCLFRHFVLFDEDWPIREDMKRARDDDF